MFMKRKIKSVKGFTLAELLIVVAIIAVLVAIGIPIFTSQLEKSREAVDLSDVRSAYAEVMMAAITGDTTAYYTKDANQTIYDSQNSVYTITVTPLKQKQSGWQTAEPITIGGVSSKAGEPYWKGQPGPDGYCIVTYHPKDDYVSFYWSGGNDSSNSTVTPTPTPWIPTVTPIPTETPDEPAINIPDGVDLSIKEYPDRPPTVNDYMNITRGQVYKKGQLIYIVTNSERFNYYDYKAPGMEYTDYLFVKPTGRVMGPESQVLNEKGEKILKDLKSGDIYVTKDGIKYMVDYGINSSRGVAPTENESGWVRIIDSY